MEQRCCPPPQNQPPHPPTSIPISCQTCPLSGLPLPFPSGPFSTDGRVLNTPPHTLFCSFRFKSRSPHAGIAPWRWLQSVCDGTAGQRVRPDISARLQLSSVFLSSLDAVTSQGRGREWLSGIVPDLCSLICWCLRESWALGRGRHPGLLAPRSDLSLGRAYLCHRLPGEPTAMLSSRKGLDIRWGDSLLLAICASASFADLQLNLLSCWF